MNKKKGEIKKHISEIEILRREIDDLRRRNIELEKSEKELKKAEKKTSKINKIFSLLGFDAFTNINIIVEHTCEILEGACSLYNRLDDQNKSLYTWSKYNAPADLKSRDKPEGHICYEATIKGKDKPVVIEELRGTSFEKTDPNVKKYSLRSYLGYPVIVKGKVIGSLCIVDTKSRKFNPIEINIISTLAKALSFEEDRKQFMEALKKSEEKYRKIFEEFQDLYYLTDKFGRLKDLSPSVKMLSGYDYDELIGRYVVDFLKNRNDRHRYIKELRKTGSIRDYELTLLGKGE